VAPGRAGYPAVLIRAAITWAPFADVTPMRPARVRLIPGVRNASVAARTAGSTGGALRLSTYHRAVTAARPSAGSPAAIRLVPAAGEWAAPRTSIARSGR